MLDYKLGGAKTFTYIRFVDVEFVHLTQNLVNLGRLKRENVSDLKMKTYLSNWLIMFRVMKIIKYQRYVMDNSIALSAKSPLNTTICSPLLNLHD